MSLVYCNSFDGYSSAEVPLDMISGGNIVSGGRNGKGLNGGGTVVLPYNASWVVGFAANFGAQAPLAIFSAATPNVSSFVTLFIEADLSVSVYMNNGGILLGNVVVPTIHLGTWIYFEIMFTVTSLSHGGGGNTLGVANVNVRVNKQTVLGDPAGLAGLSGDTGTLQSSTLTNLPQCNVFILTKGAALASIIFDDYYIFNQDGTTNNVYAGDVKIGVTSPDADVNTAFSLFPGGSPNSFGLINEIPPNYDTNYLFDNTNGDFDNFLYQPIAPFTGEILGVFYRCFARKDTEGSRAIQLTMGGTSTPGFLGAFEYLGDSYQYYRLAFDTGPAGATWTVALFNATSFGIFVATIPVPS